MTILDLKSENEKLNADLNILKNTPSVNEIEMQRSIKEYQETLKDKQKEISSFNQTLYEE